MQRKQFEKWLKNIYATRDEEISCTECFDLISRFVELETSGRNAAAELPLVEQHVGQCQACRDEYATLRDLIRLENQGHAPSLDDLRHSIP